MASIFKHVQSHNFIINIHAMQKHVYHCTVRTKCFWENHHIIIRDCFLDLSHRSSCWVRQRWWCAIPLSKGRNSHCQPSWSTEPLKFWMSSSLSEWHGASTQSLFECSLLVSISMLFYSSILTPSCCWYHKVTSLYIHHLHLCTFSWVQHFCNPMNCSPPGFSVHEIFQAKIQEWVAVFYS